MTTLSFDTRMTWRPSTPRTTRSTTVPTKATSNSARTDARTRPTARTSGLSVPLSTRRGLGLPLPRAVVATGAAFLLLPPSITGWGRSAGSLSAPSVRLHARPRDQLADTRTRGAPAGHRQSVRGWGHQGALIGALIGPVSCVSCVSSWYWVTPLRRMRRLTGNPVCGTSTHHRPDSSSDRAFCRPPSRHWSLGLDPIAVRS